MIRTHGIGRLTDEPDIRYGQDGKISTATFTLATDRYSSAGNKTDFIRHIAFGYNATFAQNYLHKGTKIFIEGHIQTGSFEDKNGNKHYATDIVVDSFEFCEKKGEDDNKAREVAQAIDDQMELPFK